MGNSYYLFIAMRPSDTTRKPAQDDKRRVRQIINNKVLSYLLLRTWQPLKLEEDSVQIKRDYILTWLLEVQGKEWQKTMLFYMLH